MVKKAIDSRIPALIRNGAQEHKRSFFVIVGDRQKDVIVNLYHILLNVDIKVNKSVVWAYKNKLLGFTSHRKKREKKIKKEIKRGIRDIDTEDPFELFISTQNIRYVYYKETEKILGNTYGMCILQDFEAITPNLLARTVETVEGGGLVLLLLKGMKSLKQLYTLSMDIHSRYRTEAHGDVVARFNERFILSLGSCESCLVVDDELNVLPISGGKNVQALPPPDPSAPKSDRQLELEKIQDDLAETQPVGSLVKLAKTVDQAKALLTFVDAIAEKTLQSTVTLTAARGRGKSAALGVAVAAAIAHGYSNIFITSPHPDNLKTLFEFVFKGFDALNYLDHVDYSIIQSTNPDFNKAIVRVNIHRSHRQTIQYIQPQDAHVLGQAELVVIDEAAAIPLPLVRKLIGPYLVFMASTINGYEGTGRSLSLKLIQQLREQSHGSSKSAPSNGSADAVDRSGKAIKEGSSLGRSLREITLAEPIRYAPGDAVEKWLNTLLCLDATLPRSSRLKTHGCPHPSQCELLMVNRDTLFSFHAVSERFLQSMMALYVASHYKNSPNDLQLMSDAPAHQLYVLVPPVDDNADRLPEPLCVIQVALEGRISRESVIQSLNRGERAAGDLIPWLVSQQFQDEEFASLSGARVVRIATNPEYIGMGYGSRALQLLVDFYEGKFADLSEGAASNEPEEMVRVTDAELERASLLQDNVQVRDIRSMPPLFTRLSERRPPGLDYVGVSYGLTLPLFKFWARAAFAPVYVRQTPNDLTGEHSCVMVRALAAAGAADAAWLPAFAADFHRRFLSLLSYRFRAFAAATALTIEAAAAVDASCAPLTKAELDARFGPFDLKRLERYAAQMVDHHLIVDLVPGVAALYFSGRLRAAVRLSRVQQAILLAVGLQRRDVDDVAAELGLAAAQVLGLFVKVVRKFAAHFRALVEGAVAETMPDAPEPEDANGAHDDDEVVPRVKVVQQSLGQELEEAGAEIDAEEKERMRAMIDALPLSRYEIADGGKADWEGAEAQVRAGKGSTVSVKKKWKDEDGEGKRKASGAFTEAVKEADAVRDGSGKKHKKTKR